MLGQLTFFLLLQQRFSTIALNAAKSRSTILLESRTKTLPRAAQRMLGSYMRLLEQCLRTIVHQVTRPTLPATMTMP